MDRFSSLKSFARAALVALTLVTSAKANNVDQKNARLDSRSDLKQSDSKIEKTDMTDYLLGSLGEYAGDFECRFYEKASKCDADRLDVKDSFVFKNVKFDTKYGDDTMSNFYYADRVEYYGELRKYKDILPKRIECKDYIKRSSDGEFISAGSCALESTFYDMKIRMSSKDKNQSLAPNISLIDYALEYSSLMDNISDAPIGKLNQMNSKLNRVSVEITKKDGFSQLTRDIDFYKAGATFGYAVGYIRASDEIKDQTKKELEKLLAGIRDFVISDSDVKRIVVKVSDKGETYFNLSGIRYFLSMISPLEYRPEVIMDMSKLSNNYRFYVEQYRYKPKQQ